MEGFIKLHRKMLDWERYDDINVFKLFIHILFKANFKYKKWRGIEINRGQWLTSLDTISKETKLSYQQIRTALKKIENTGEITNQSTNHYRLITVNNYEKYQDNNKQLTSEITSNQQATNKQLTTTEEGQECKEGQEHNNIVNENNSNNSNNNSMFKPNSTLNQEKEKSSAKKEKEDSYIEELEDLVYKWNNEVKVKNKNVPDKELRQLPKIQKINDSLKRIYNQKRKEYTKEEITKGLNNYIKDICNRTKDPGGYYNHRFTLLQFLKQYNGLDTFINL